MITYKTKTMEVKQVNGDVKEGGRIPGPTNPMVTPLLTDLYQFTMAYAYWKAGKHNERAVLVVSLFIPFFFFFFLDGIH